MAARCSSQDDGTTCSSRRAALQRLAALTVAVPLLGAPGLARAEEAAAGFDPLRGTCLPGCSTWFKNCSLDCAAWLLNYKCTAAHGSPAPVARTRRLRQATLLLRPAALQPSCVHRQSSTGRGSRPTAASKSWRPSAPRAPGCRWAQTGGCASWFSSCGPSSGSVACIRRTSLPVLLGLHGRTCNPPPAFHM